MWFPYNHLLGALNSAQVSWQIQWVVSGAIANNIEMLSSRVWELGFLLLYANKQKRKDVKHLLNWNLLQQFYMRYLKCLHDDKCDF